MGKQFLEGIFSLMDITPENAAQTRARLLRVIAHARMHVETGDYVFAECPVDNFAIVWVAHCKALVRDERVWSALVPAELVANKEVAATQTPDKFTLLCFHFDSLIPNSGFVG
jgi:hypothetical protein